MFATILITTLWSGPISLGSAFLLASITGILVIIAVQFIVNSISDELKPNSGETLRDAVGRMENASMQMQAAVKRLEEGQVTMTASDERVEAAGKIVASDLAEAHQRAADVGEKAEPGEASDAAAKPEGVAGVKPPAPMEVTVVNPPEDPVNAEIGNTEDRPVPTRATIEKKQAKLDVAQEKLDKQKESIEHGGDV